MTMGKLDGKFAAITGAGTGIGRGIARAFAREGASLVIGSRNRKTLDFTADYLRGQGTDVVVIQTDVTVEGQVEALFEGAVREFGRIDIAVNNAGTGDYVPLAEMSLERWDRVIAVNLTGVFLGIREAMKIMKEQGGGRIINIGSISSKRPRMDQGAYSASKAGVESLTRSAALEGREHGIVVSCLHPGVVDVRQELEDAAQGKEPAEPTLVTDDIAAAALTIATLPMNVNMLETTVLPVQQLYIGRG